MMKATPMVHVPQLDRTVFAHRGLSSKAPENTMAAFELAADSGASWIETDVDILADGTPILIHDTLLDRTTDHSGPIYDLEYADLKDIDAGAWFGPQYSGLTLPTLRELIRFLNERKLNVNIEFKQNEQGAARTKLLLDGVLAELEFLDPERQVIISSFSQPILMLMNVKAPQYARAVLYETAALYGDWLSVAELCGASYIHLEDKDLSKTTVEAMTNAGYGVNVWTVNRSDRAEELFEWGCTGVFTDVADEFVAEL